MKEKQLIAEALRFWLDKKRTRQNELASGVDVESSTISQIVNAKRLPSMDLTMKIAKYFNLSMAEFFACRDEDKPDIVFVKKLKARPRAGSGGLETDGDQDGYYAFHSSFLVRKRGAPASMAIFEIAGDSMSPTLDDKDLIMVNTSDRDIRTGYIYLLRMGDELMVKRLENRPGGIVAIRSDNPAYKELEYSKADESSDIEVFGRMVWSCREY